MKNKIALETKKKSKILKMHNKLIISVKLLKLIKQFLKNMRSNNVNLILLKIILTFLYMLIILFYLSSYVINYIF